MTRLVLGQRRRQLLAAALLFSCCGLLARGAAGRDLHVDPDRGDDGNDGVAAPVRSIRAAIILARPGDTIHLQPKIYRDYAPFYSSHGEPDLPITLDGHGATLDGSDPLQPDQWQEIEPGLFQNDDLMPLTDAIIDRWFFLWGGKMNRMGRVSKATSPALKAPEQLKPGEWTFVKDPAREAPEGYIAGAFYIKLEPGRSLAEAEIMAPIRPAGILITQSNSHLVIRNLTATHVYNDGYNISGHCHDIVLENIRAIDCGDDGISAHTDSQYEVDGFVSIGNATGICDTGVSKTDYRNIFIADCLAHDLFFIQSGRYTITNGVILSSARHAVTLDTLNEPGSCRLELKDVYIERLRGASLLSVAEDCELTAKNVTLRNMDIVVSGGKVSWMNSIVSGQVPPEGCITCTQTLPGAAASPKCQERLPDITIAAPAIWQGDCNFYAVASISVGEQTFSPSLFANFQQAVGSEANSQWSEVAHLSRTAGAFGAAPAALDAVPAPPEYGHPWR